MNVLYIYIYIYNITFYPRYHYIGLCETSSKALRSVWYQLFQHSSPWNFSLQLKQHLVKRQNFFNTSLIYKYNQIINSKLPLTHTNSQRKSSVLKHVQRYYIIFGYDQFCLNHVLRFSFVILKFFPFLFPLVIQTVSKLTEKYFSSLGSNIRQHQKSYFLLPKRIVLQEFRTACRNLDSMYWQIIISLRFDFNL